MRNRFIITGIVQGVGFRPFIYRLAGTHGLAGWVKNATEGVHIEVEGLPPNIADFTNALPREKPARAQIHSLAVQEIPDTGELGFRIAESDPPTQSVPLISPDLATCPDCRREVNSQENRVVITEWN